MGSAKFLGTMDEWMRDQERRMTSVERRKRRLSTGGGGQTTITVSDTDTIDLTLTGDPGAGYGLSADVTAVPVARLTGPGTIAPALLPAPTPTPVTVTDTTTVDLTLTGNGTTATPWNVKGDVAAVPVALLTGPGTIAPALLPAPTPTPVTVTDTTTVDLTLTGAGTAGSPWNIKGDVLRIPSGAIAVSDTGTVDLTLTGTGTPADPYTISAVVTSAPPPFTPTYLTNSYDTSFTGSTGQDVVFGANGVTLTPGTYVVQAGAAATTNVADTVSCGINIGAALNVLPASTGAPGISTGQAGYPASVVSRQVMITVSSSAVYCAVVRRNGGSAITVQNAAGGPAVWISAVRVA